MTDKTRDFYRWTRDKQKAFEEQVKQANDTKILKIRRNDNRTDFYRHSTKPNQS